MDRHLTMAYTITRERPGQQLWTEPDLKLGPENCACRGQGRGLYNALYCVWNTWICTFFDITLMLFRNCTRFSLVHDGPQKRFKHAFSLYLRTNAFFAKKKFHGKIIMTFILVG